MLTCSLLRGASETFLQMVLTAECGFSDVISSIDNGDHENENVGFGYCRASSVKKPNSPNLTWKGDNIGTSTPFKESVLAISLS